MRGKFIRTPAHQADPECAICGYPAPPDFQFDPTPGVIVHPDCYAYTHSGALTNGKLPSRTMARGQRLRNTCGDLRCVNPEHLELEGGEGAAASQAAEKGTAMRYRVLRDNIHWSQRPCPEASWQPWTDESGRVDNHWEVEFSTLRELQEFADRYGTLRISNCSSGPLIELDDPNGYDEELLEVMPEVRHLIELDKVCFPMAHPSTMIFHCPKTGRLITGTGESPFGSG